jgi:hypothetical protein
MSAATTSTEWPSTLGLVSGFEGDWDKHVMVGEVAVYGCRPTWSL